jgi:phage terminase small subunit
MTRPRKPTKLLETTGAFLRNPQRRRQRQHEPQIEGEVKKPAYLKGRAARIWDEYAPQLIQAGILNALGSYSFATWCCLEAEWEEGPQRMNSARIAVKKAYGGAFGLDASSQAKVVAVNTGSSEQEKDPAEKYFNDRRSGKQVLQ